MNAGIAAYVILTQNTDVTNIVGVNIFPEVAEQETATPFIVYQLLSVAPEDTHDGPSKLDEVRFEFLCYADSYALAADLGSKVRGALDRVSGTYNGVNVESVQFNDVDIDTIDAPRRFAQVLTFTFRIKRDNVQIAQGTPVTGAKLGDLYDVDTTGVTDGQVIAYDAAAQEWQPADDASGVTELGQLTDVQFGQSGPETGELLKYDGSEWTNDTIVKSEIGLGNVDNTSDANKPVSTATQTALNAKADTSAVPTDLNDLSDVTIVGTPAGNQALIYDATAGAFKSQVSYTNRFEDDVETGKQGITGTERAYSVKGEGDGVFADPESDTPAAGKVIVRKIYHKTGFITDADVIGDYTLIHTFADDTAYADTVATFEGFKDGATYGVPPFTLLQTWEEVDQANLLLDTYTGAAAAYSLRKLRTLYTGDAIRVRRSSDNTEQDIGFSNDELDTVSLTAFAGSGDAFVKTWYDQSGNSNDATQTTTSAQPKIVSSGAVITENGKPAVQFDGANDALNSSSSVSLPLNNAFALVAKGISTATDEVLNINYTSGLNVRIQSNNVRVLYTDSDQNNVASASNNQFLLYAGRQSSSNTVYGSLDGGAQLSDTSLDSGSWNTATGTLHVGARNGTSLEWDGLIQEVVYYASDKLNDRTNIEDNINTFYSIY
jgi:hypothetical protein